jgi:hypothetical protein
MIVRASRYAEIVIKVSPARLNTRQQLSSIESSRDTENKRAYDALIYTSLSLPNISPAKKTPPGQPDSVAGMPLVGVEQIKMRWSHYQEYLAAFVEGEKAPYLMRERLLETMSSGLEALFSQPPQTSEPVRMWWSSDTPELDDVPWELLTLPERKLPLERFSFVRGLPPDTPLPILPIDSPLRLALIYNPSYTPNTLVDALGEQPNLEVTLMPFFHRKALEEVAAKGYELIHIVADGMVSSAYEGVLYFHEGKDPSEEISPGELSALLRSSRANLLCLTNNDYSSPDMVQMGDWVVPSAYRAFAYLGSSRLALPSIVAPLGPLEPSMLYKFWKDFYQELSGSFNLHKAMAKALTGAMPLPMALFLRHRQETLFRHGDTTDRTKADPAQLGTALQLSQSLIEQLKEYNEIYGSLPESVNTFISNESARQQDLSSALDEYLTPEEEETSHEQ